MPDLDITRHFIRLTFRSVWSLELLLLLRQRPDHLWPVAELIAGLRASQHVISQSLDGLLAAGLVSLSEDGSARYAPVSDALDAKVADAADFYSKSPDAARRLIVAAGIDPAARFADAFRLRKD